MCLPIFLNRGLRAGAIRRIALCRPEGILRLWPEKRLDFVGGRYSSVCRQSTTARGRMPCGEIEGCSVRVSTPPVGLGASVLSRGTRGSNSPGVARGRAFAFYSVQIHGQRALNDHCWDDLTSGRLPVSPPEVQGEEPHLHGSQAACGRLLFGHVSHVRSKKHRSYRSWRGAVRYVELLPVHPVGTDMTVDSAHGPWRVPLFGPPIAVYRSKREHARAATRARS